jgi:putative addiction module killer protein
MNYKIEHYISESNADVVASWLESLRDFSARRSIIKRIERIEAGNFGDCRYLRDGVSELRIDIGAGYRLYYSSVNNIIVLLLCGGNKKKQDSDINNAITYLNKWKENQL